jgi:hypothetical protein
MNSDILLNDLQKRLKRLEEDLRNRLIEYPELDAQVRAEYALAKDTGRTGQVYELWRDEFITQVAVGWLLSCVFVRFIEDNRLLDTPHQQNVWIAGTGDRMQVARDNHTLYFREHPTESDREYIENIFRTVAKYPGVRELFDERYNPVWKLGPSGDEAGRLIEFWQQVDPSTGELRYNFTDIDWDTRFLGDLYQDLSEAAQKKYALKQTPIFVEEFILDRTLRPAINEFGYDAIRMIDPTCGSGHFLLGAFDILFDLRQQHEASINSRELVRRTLLQIAGVDLNPFAIAIARFRLLIAALKKSELKRLQDAPAFEFKLAVGDSLLHGEHPPLRIQETMEHAPEAHYYMTEDRDSLNRILRIGYYHAVVGNPPYITVKDAGLNQTYRRLYGSCHMKYSLAVPFMERFFELAIKGESNNGGTGIGAGFVGMITTNAFMKREYGKRLIESYIPRWDITHVIDTSGAYIPGHGTPTVIIFGRNREPIAPEIRTVMGIKGEPTTPADAADGKVWKSIIKQLDLPKTQNEFISVTDSPRENFHKHPWSIGGGGAAELKEVLDKFSISCLKNVISSIGIGIVTLEDSAFSASVDFFRRYKLKEYNLLVEGELVRDWLVSQEIAMIFPYNDKLEPYLSIKAQNYLWLLKTILKRRIWFRKTQEERGLAWFEYGLLSKDNYAVKVKITFAEVASHNHFVLDRGGKVFKQTAPVIKLPKDSSEEEHLELLGLLNSSTACFWGRQTFFPKGGFASGKWEERLAWNGTNLSQFPIPKERPLELARTLDQLSQQLQERLPSTLIQNTVPTPNSWQQAKDEATLIQQRMIALQEELDWHCYYLYGLTDKSLTIAQDRVPPIKLGERPFEIILARKMASGEVQSSWFERHNSTPITEIPSHWTEEYKQLTQERISTIEVDSNIRLIEQPECKRRWNTEPWDIQAERALREWLLNRLEDTRFWTTVEIISIARLADRVRSDAEFMKVAEMYRGRSDFDITNLVNELVKAEAVPLLPIFRYKEPGLRKRELWERTWELQRLEDQNPDQKLDIPVPPKYQSKDFIDQNYWRLRGKLDVPKERFISFPKCERNADQTLPIAWAGWNHLEQAQAIANYYETMKIGEGWGINRLLPLLTGLLELIPWLLQWHNDLDPHLNLRMGDFYKGFLEDEARSFGLTTTKIRNWKPS